LTLALVFATPFIGFADAQQSGSSTEVVAQGFTVEGSAADFVDGALVSTKDNTARIVQLATTSTADRLVGVVSEAPLVALSGEETTVQVATSGPVRALVSDINGSIRAGDKITPSPIEGVGMLATGNDHIIGTARAGLDGNAAKTQEITDSKGGKHTVRLGRVPLQVGISFYQTPTSGFVPPLVQGFANTIAGRPVSFVRVAACSMLLLLAVVSAATLMYAAVRSSLVSLGRNPMAAKAIRRGLIQVGVATVLILALVLLASYIILTA
jgi:hypothetical protein